MALVHVCTCCLHLGSGFIDLIRHASGLTKVNIDIVMEFVVFFFACAAVQGGGLVCHKTTLSLLLFMPGVRDSLALALPW